MTTQAITNCAEIFSGCRIVFLLPVCVSTLKSCTQIQGWWSFTSTSSPTMVENKKRISFSDRVGVQAQVLLKLCDRGAHDQHSLTQLAGVHAKKCASKHSISCNMVLWIVFEPYNAANHVNILYSSSWVNECRSCVPLSHIFKRTLNLGAWLQSGHANWR